MCGVREDGAARKHPANYSLGFNSAPGRGRKEEEENEEEEQEDNHHHHKQVNKYGRNSVTSLFLPIITDACQH